MAFKYFLCPVEGCDYYTGTHDVCDDAAKEAVIAHLQRKRHGLSRSEAKSKCANLTVIESDQPKWRK